MAQAMAERRAQQRGIATRSICGSSKYIARRLARRYAGRFIPLIGAPIGAMQNGGVTKQLGERALKYYARP